MSAADICRARGWVVGTRLLGVQHGNGYVNETTIQITAIGERLVLAKTLTNRSTARGAEWTEHATGHEDSWALDHRDWVPA